MHSASMHKAFSSVLIHGFVEWACICWGFSKLLPFSLLVLLFYVYSNGKSHVSFHNRASESTWGTLEWTRIHTTCRCPAQLRQSCKSQYHHNHHQNVSVDPHNLGCFHTHLYKTPPLSLHGIWWLYVLILFLVQAEVFWRYHRYFCSSMGRSSPILGTYLWLC